MCLYNKIDMWYRYIF